MSPARVEGRTSMGTEARRGSGGRITAGVLIVAFVVVAVVLVLTEMDKWTCAPPDGVWVEAPDRCIALP
jgi:hypothetical protein